MRFLLVSVLAFAGLFAAAACSDDDPGGAAPVAEQDGASDAPSEVAPATEAGLPSIAAPVISPAPNPGAPFDHPQCVSIVPPGAGATVYYTLDGSTPSIDGLVYAGPFVVEGNTTVQAIATRGAAISDVTSAAFTIVDDLLVAEAPSFSPPAGAAASPTTITLGETTANAVVCVTQDGSEPTCGVGTQHASCSADAGGILYPHPSCTHGQDLRSVTITGNLGTNVTVKAAACADGVANGAVVSQTYFF